MINTYNITKTQGLPFIAFLFHYMGPQNTHLEQYSLAQNNSSFVFSIHIYTYMQWKKKRKYTQLTAIYLDSRTESRF